MPTKNLIQRSDNTRVDVGTAELPKWKAPFVPDYFRGQQEYNKGNYTDPHARAYAEKVSGKVETLSPEFDLLTAAGLSGLKWLTRKTVKTAGQTANSSFLFAKPPTKPEAGYVYTGNNFLESRVNDRAVKRLGLSPDHPLIKSLFSRQPINLNRPKQKEYIEQLLKDANENFRNNVLNSRFSANSYKDKYFIVYNSRTLNNREFNNFLNHERDHILNYLSKIKSKRPILEDLPDLEEFRRRMYARGYTQENDNYINDVYKYLTDNNGEELVARGTQLKDALEFTKADQKLTFDDIKYLSKTWKQHPDFNNYMNQPNMKPIQVMNGGLWD